MSKFQNRVLDYVCNKPDNPYRLYNGEKGLSITQVTKRFRNHHRWHIMPGENCICFQDRAIIQRRAEDKRSLLILLLRHLLEHPRNIYEVRIATRKMNNALFWLPRIFKNNKNIAQHASQFFHYVDWLKPDFELMNCQTRYDFIFTLPNMMIIELETLVCISTECDYYHRGQNIRGFSIDVKVVEEEHMEEASLYYGIPVDIPITDTARWKYGLFVNQIFEMVVRYESFGYCQECVHNGFDLRSAKNSEGLTIEEFATKWIPDLKKRKRLLKNVLK